MVFALALVLSLVLAAALASMVTAPLRRIARATQAMARGDLSTRVPGSRLEELGALAQSFNDMAGRLKTSFDDLVGEVETRKSRERELEESEARLRASDDRLQLAIDAAGLGIWDWDVEQDRLVWDDSMYRLYGVRKDEFSGAFDAWSRCLVPEDLARATGDIEAALRGDREYRSDFRVRRADGAIRTIRGVGQTIRGADGRPVRMVGINRDVTDLISAEREREQLVHELGERVKELRLLHATARLLQRDRPFNRELLDELVVLMPAAWQYPECCEARIVYGDLEVSTAGWRDSPWKQSASVHDERRQRAHRSGVPRGTPRVCRRAVPSRGAGVARLVRRDAGRAIWSCASTRSTSKRSSPAARPSCAPPRRPPRAPAGRRAPSWPTCRTRSARR